MCWRMMSRALGTVGASKWSTVPVRTTRMSSSPAIITNEPLALRKNRNGRTVPSASTTLFTMPRSLETSCCWSNTAAQNVSSRVVKTSQLNLLSNSSRLTDVSAPVTLTRRYRDSASDSFLASIGTAFGAWRRSTTSMRLQLRVSRPTPPSYRLPSTCTTSPTWASFVMPSAHSNPSWCSPFVMSIHHGVEISTTPDRLNGLPAA